MKSKTRIPVVKHFWYKADEFSDTTLYEDQLGWTIEEQVESGGYTDTKDIWDNLMTDTNIRGVGWDLCFYYPPSNTFYYIDQINQVLFKLPILSGWDGEAIFCSVDIKPQLVSEENELMDFDTVSEVWDKFRIDGKDMRYILEHSVLFLST